VTFTGFNRIARVWALFQLTIRLAALVLAFIPYHAVAQEEQPKNNKLTGKEIINYIANEKVVAPGVGFINGQLGDSMTYILEVWGEPVDSRKTGILGSVEFLYRPDPNTMVVFTGKDEVNSISIKGNSASLLSTRRGGPGLESPPSKLPGSTLVTNTKPCVNGWNIPTSVSVFISTGKIASTPSWSSHLATKDLH